MFQLPTRPWLKVKEMFRYWWSRLNRIQNTYQLSSIQVLMASFVSAPSKTAKSASNVVLKCLGWEINFSSVALFLWDIISSRDTKMDRLSQIVCQLEKGTMKRARREKKATTVTSFFERKSTEIWLKSDIWYVARAEPLYNWQCHLLPWVHFVDLSLHLPWRCGIALDTELVASALSTLSTIHLC